MIINREKLILFSAIVWGVVVLLPIGSAVEYEIRNLPITAFILLILYCPVWIILGWRWLTDFRSISPFSVCLLLFLINGLWSSYMFEKHMEIIFAYAPLITSAVFLYFQILLNPKFLEDTKENTIQLWKKPPAWVVLLLLVPIYLISHMMIDLLTPFSKLAPLIAFGTCWGSYILLRAKD